MDVAEQTVERTEIIKSHCICYWINCTVIRLRTSDSFNRRLWSRSVKSCHLNAPASRSLVRKRRSGAKWSQLPQNLVRSVICSELTPIYQWQVRAYISRCNNSNRIPIALLVLACVLLQRAGNCKKEATMRRSFAKHTEHCHCACALLLCTCEPEETN